MAIDSHYIPAFSIEDVLLDKDTGAPLSGGLVYFYKDNQRTVTKAVYQITGTSPNYSYIQLPDNPLTLSSIGTFVDSLGNPIIPYFYPYDANGDPEYYYVVVTSSTGVPQFAREAVPYINIQDSSEVLSVITNELSNPQFAEVLFDSDAGSHVYSFSAAVSQVVNIAPDWDLVVTCPTTGTVTLTQLRPSASSNIETNPGTMLTIESAGITKLLLRQRIYGSPNLWGSGYLSATFLAKTYQGTESTLSLYYSQSGGTVVDKLLVSATLLASGNYKSYPRSVLIPISDSSGTFPNAYVDIFFDIPLSIKIDITSVMLAYTGLTSINDIVYDQESLGRQVDHLFHYYKPGLDYKPISSYLKAWNFPLNPAQFGDNGTLAIGAYKGAYVWDQTIIMQSIINSISYSRNTNGSLIATASVDTQIALIQYLEPPEVCNIISRANSVAATLAASAPNLVGNISLWYTTNAALPVVAAGTNNTFITTLDANGHPSAVVAGWVEIPRNTGSGAANFNFPVDITDLDAATLGFSGWDGLSGTVALTAKFFAIVVGTGVIPAAVGVEFNQVALVPGDVPTIPAPQTANQVLRDCMYYYESSFPAGTVLGASLINAYALLQPVQAYSGNTVVNPGIFEIKYNEFKRTSAPSIKFYSKTGTADNVTLEAGNTTGVTTGDVAVAGNWVQTGLGSKGVYYTPAASATTQTRGGATGPFGSVIFNCIIDARLGVVV